MNAYKTLLASQIEAEAFVRRALGRLERDTRTLALHAVAEWHATGIVAPSLFEAIGGLQRPSWGTWNGLLASLLQARREALRSADAVRHQAAQQAQLLALFARVLEERLEDSLRVRLRPLWELTGSQSSDARRVSELFVAPTRLRNRLAHDLCEGEWWVEAAAALRPLVEYFAGRDLVALTCTAKPLPSPWFEVVAGETLAFNGLDRRRTVFVDEQGRARFSEQATPLVLGALAQMLGKREARDSDLNELLARLAPEEIQGVVLDDYLVGKPVGAGAFATVHVGRQLSTGRKVAVKVLRDGLDSDARERLELEARHLSRFNHPGIVGVVGHGEAPWREPRNLSLSGTEWFSAFSRGSKIKNFLVLEWVEGRTLAQEAQHPGPHWTSTRQKIEHFAAAAEALALVHANGLIHRDLKPSNLMLTTDGRIKLMDFGIARTDSEERTLRTQTGMTVGTPAYMAPEQLRSGDDASVGPAADVYAVCTTFFELFTGRRPFESAGETSEHAREKKLRGEQPPRARKLHRGLPWQLDLLLAGGLQPELGDRCQDGSALHRDLRHVLADEPIQYRRPSLLRRLSLGYRRHQTVCNLLGLFALVAAIGVVSYLRDLRDEQAKTAHQGQLASLRGDSAVGAVRDLVHDVQTTLGDLPGERVRLARQTIFDRAQTRLMELRGLELETTQLSSLTGEAISRMGDLALEMRDSARAEKAYGEAESIFRGLLGPGPGSPTLVKELAGVLDGRSKLAVQTSDMAQAMALEREAYGLTKELLVHEETADAQRCISVSLGNLGMLLSESGAHEEARVSAEDSLRHALRAHELEPSDKSLRRLVEAHCILSQVLDAMDDTRGQERELRAAVGDFEALSAAKRAERELTLQRVDLSCALADALREQGRVAEALEEMAQVTAQARALYAADEQSVAGRTMLAGVLEQTGHCQMTAGAWAEALASYTETVEFWGQLSAEDPRQSFYAMNQAISLGNVANALSGLGRHQEAAAICRQRVEVLGQLARSDPKNGALRTEFGEAWMKLGQEAGELGERNEQRAACENAIRELLLAVGQTQADAQATQALAMSYYQAADVARVQQDVLAAEAYAEQAVQVVLDLAQSHGETVHNRLLLATALTTQADVRAIALHDDPGALTIYVQASALYTGVLDHDPEELSAWISRARIGRQMADSYLELGDSVHAREALERAQSDVAAALARSPDDLNALKRKASNLDLLGQLHSREGDLDAAFACARECVQTYERLSGKMPDNLAVLRQAQSAWTILAILHNQQGRPIDAEDAYRRSLVIARRSADASGDMIDFFGVVQVMYALACVQGATSEEETAAFAEEARGYLDDAQQRYGENPWYVRAEGRWYSLALAVAEDRRDQGLALALAQRRVTLLKEKRAEESPDLRGDLELALWECAASLRSTGQESLAKPLLDEGVSLAREDYQRDRSDQQKLLVLCRWIEKQLLSCRTLDDSLGMYAAAMEGELCSRWMARWDKAWIAKADEYFEVITDLESPWILAEWKRKTYQPADAVAWLAYARSNRSATPEQRLRGYELAALDPRVSELMGRRDYREAAIASLTKLPADPQSAQQRLLLAQRWLTTLVSDCLEEIHAADALLRQQVTPAQKADTATSRVAARDTLRSLRDSDEGLAPLRASSWFAELFAPLGAVEAIDRLEAIRAGQPLGSAQLLESGDAWLALGDLEGARLAFGALTSTEATSARGWFGLGQVLLQLGECNGAVEALSRATTLAPTDALAHAWLAKAMYTSRDTGRAVEECRSALALGADEPWVGQLCAAGELLLGNAAAAASLSREVLTRMPDSVPALVTLGEALYAEQLYPAALAELSRAVSLAPEQAYAHRRLAEVLLASGDAAGAEQQLREALRLAPADSKVRRSLSDLLLAADKAAQARAVLEERTLQAPEDSTAWIDFSWFLAQPGADGTARESLAALSAGQRAVELTHYADPLALHTYAQARFVTGDVRGALRAEAKALALSEGGPGVEQGAKAEMRAALERFRAADNGPAPGLAAPAR